MYLIILISVYYLLNLIIFRIIHKTKTKKQYRHNETIVSFVGNSTIYKPLLSSSDELSD